jgi:hypothetical protein
VYTFLGHLELSALSNLDGLHGLVTRALRDVLNLVHDVIAFEDLAEDDVAAIEPAGDDGGDEELTGSTKSGVSRTQVVSWRVLPSVCILARVGHAEKAFASMLELEVLIGELGTVDGLATGAVFEQCQYVMYDTGMIKLTTTSEVTREKSAHIRMLKIVFAYPPWIMNCLMTRWKVEPS